MEQVPKGEIAQNKDRQSEKTASSGRKWLTRAWQIAQVLIGILLIYFVSQYLQNIWDELRSYKFSIHVLVFSLASLPLLLFYWVYSQTWVYLLRDLEQGAQTETRFDLSRIFFIAFVARYLPAGKIFNIGGRIELYHRAGGSRWVALSSFIIEQSYLFGGAGLLAWIAILLTDTVELPEILLDYRSGFLILTPFAITGLWFLPEVPSIGSRWLFSWKWMMAPLHSFIARMQAISRYLLVNVLQGTAVLAILTAIVPEVSQLPWIWLLIVAAYPLSRIGGQLVTFIPSGIGVREGLFSLFLDPFVGPEAPFIAASFMRLLSVVFEFGILAVLTLAKKWQEVRVNRY